MPEYLAPGVYVEETSFRAKSIEGVGTSTTGFIGPTRRGPLGETPELVTSFPDFERIYGGLDDLQFGTNYLAHAVRAYFNEGGGRLYVARAYQAPAAAAPGAPADLGRGHAFSQPVVAGAADAARAWFVARFPGAVGNARVEVALSEAVAGAASADGAPEGTLLRVGAAAPDRPASVPADTDAPAAWSIPPDAVLRVAVDGTETGIQFLADSAEAVAGAELGGGAADVNIPAGQAVLRVTLNGGAQQEITLPEGDTPVDALVIEINRQLRGGYARRTGAGDAGPAGHLVIGTDRAGASARVQVDANAALGFNAAADEDNAGTAENNVPDITAVTVDDLDRLLRGDGTGDGSDTGVRARLVSGRLRLETAAVGAGVTLEVRAPGGTDVSVHTILGLPVGVPAAGEVGGAAQYFVKVRNEWQDSGGGSLPAGTFDGEPSVATGPHFLAIDVDIVDGDGNRTAHEGLGFDRRHPSWIGSVLAERPSRRADALEQMFALRIGNQVDAFALRAALFAGGPAALFNLTNGSDGAEPTEPAYTAALDQLDSLTDISIIAAPGHSAYADYRAIMGRLLIDVNRARAYRIAVLDTPPAITDGQAREVRSQIDSVRAALYYPWVTVANPLARPGVGNVPREIDLPPSGFICGIYARNDVERGVYKAPANEVVVSALRFERDINFAQQQVLNPLGVNCLRFFPGRGYRVWGARLASSDPEWKYVNVRRYFNYLEQSIDVGTQWAVFEPNGERLWANVRDSVEAFLYNEWRSGALLGTTTEQAYFVRCDRTTMTQNDLDNGRLICLIGVAALKPAEFVIFRIGQKTADARS